MKKTLLGINTFYYAIGKEGEDVFYTPNVILGLVLCTSASNNSNLMTPKLNTKASLPSGTTGQLLRFLISKCILFNSGYPSIHKDPYTRSGLLVVSLLSKYKCENHYVCQSNNYLEILTSHKCILA